MADTPVVSYAPTDEQELIRATARRFLGEEVPRSRVREMMMSDQGFDLTLWKQMADLGWPGLAVPESHGGAGLGMVELAVLLEEMGRIVTPGPFFASAVLATSTLTRIAEPGPAGEWLPSLASGETIATLAVFERSWGWDHRRPETTAVERAGGWVVDGRKRAVLDGHLAGLFLVTAADAEGLGVYAVTSDSPGVRVDQESVLDPTRRQATVVFEQAPAIRIASGDLTAGLDWVMLLAVSALANEQVGGAQACLDMAVDYAKRRHQFGRPIGSFQAIKHRCAMMLLDVEHARSTAYHAVRVADEESELRVAAPLASSVASEAYLWVAGENIQVHGGIGFTWEHDAHLYLKRAKASSLLFGGPAHQRDRLGQALGI